VHRARLGAPDVAGVSPDRAIAGESAGTRHIDDRLARPGIGLSIEPADLLLSRYVSRQVGQMHVVVAVGEQGVADRAEDARLAAVEGAGPDQVERPARLGLVVVMPAGVVPAAAVLDLLGGQPEEEEVLLTGRFGHLDRGAVAGADRERAVD